MIDGVEQLDWPLAVARRAPRLDVSFGRVPLLHGTTLDDGYGFVKNDNFFNLTNDATPPQCDAYVRGAWGAALSANLTSLYPPSSYKPWPTTRDSLCFVAAARMETDFAYACTARQASRLSAAPVYRYLFSMHTPDGADAEWVPHGHDLPFVFQVEPIEQATAPAGARSDDARILDAFAASGDPAAGGRASTTASSDAARCQRIDGGGWHDHVVTRGQGVARIGQCTPTPVRSRLTYLLCGPREHIPRHPDRLRERRVVGDASAAGLRARLRRDRALRQVAPHRGEGRSHRRCKRT